MTEQTLPEPLLQRDVNVTEFPYMPLDVNRLLTSDTWIATKKDGKCAHALICLWCESWRQTPAASLPNNDVTLAHLAMCDEAAWNSIKATVLSGFTLCSDNRYYHPVIVEKAMTAWNQKQARKEYTKAATEERQRKRQLRKKKSRGST